MGDVQVAYYPRREHKAGICLIRLSKSDFFYPVKKTGIKLPEMSATKVWDQNWKARFKKESLFLGGTVNGKLDFLTALLRFDT